MKDGGFNSWQRTTPPKGSAIACRSLRLREPAARLADVRLLAFRWMRLFHVIEGYCDTRAALRFASRRVAATECRTGWQPAPDACLGDNREVSRAVWRSAALHRAHAGRPRSPRGARTDARPDVRPTARRFCVSISSTSPYAASGIGTVWIRAIFQSACSRRKRIDVGAEMVCCSPSMVYV